MIVSKGFYDYKEYPLRVGDASFVFFSDKGLFLEEKTATAVHSHEYCEIYYVLHGRVKIHTETEIFDLCEGDFALIPARCIHASEVEVDSARVVISFFLQKRAESDEGGWYESFCEIVRNEILFLRDFVGADAFRRLARYHFSDYSDRDELVLACLHEITVLIKESVGSKKSITPRNIFFDHDSYRNYIIDGYMENNFKYGSLEECSRLLHLSCQQTERIIKRLYAMSFRERIVFVKMRHAKNLLLNSTLSISRIAEEVGYSNAHSFFEAFRKHYCATPGKYRRSKRGGYKNSRDRG